MNEMNGGFAKPVRSRPTNNQLLYKAHFRWQHYTQKLVPGTELPSGTEACASVTSAFLQILATIHNVEACRVDKPRNILQILSTNTRRTKVVELSTGTHRVADELRRHSLSDGSGGQYSTNLDRNRYGSDNNYLFTVTKFNLDALGLCPCMVDVEIVDTRNGNEVQLVTAGEDSCSCNSSKRAELADASHFTGIQPKPVVNGSPRREMRRAASVGNINGMRRVSSAQHMRKAPSSSKLFEQSQAHSRGNSGSDLFDALLAAATGEAGPGKSQGEVVVSSRQRRIRGKGWSQDFEHGDFDDEDFMNRTGSVGKPRSKTIPRRNSVSMIIENPVLAQTGAGNSLLIDPHFGFGGDREGTAQSDQGDTGYGPDNGDDDLNKGLLRFNKQSSAVNLARLGSGATEARRLAGELKQLREDRRRLELLLEESRSALKQAEKDAEDAKAAARKAAATAANLVKAAEKENIKLDEEIVQDVEQFNTSEREIAALKSELVEVKSELEQLKEPFAKMKNFPGASKMNPNAAAAAAAALAQMNPLAMSMLPMFAAGMPPLNPFSGIHGNTPHGMPPIPPSKGLGAMQKVASMPAIYQGILSPNEQKRKAENEGMEDSPKRRLIKEESGLNEGDEEAKVEPQES